YSYSSYAYASSICPRYNAYYAFSPFGYYSPYYSPYGSPYYSYYNGYAPIVVVNSPANGGSYNPTQPHGRVVHGTGYVGGSGSSWGGTASGGGASTSSSPSSGSSSAPATSSSGGSSSEPRTAVKKPPQ